LALFTAFSAIIVHARSVPYVLITLASIAHIYLFYVTNVALLLGDRLHTNIYNMET